MSTDYRCAIKAAEASATTHCRMFAKRPPLAIPIPYENEAYSADLIKGTVSVFADGGNMIANMGSQFARSVFDEPGSMGGVISGTNRAEASWISHSFDVFFEGKPACRLTDKMFMNHGNTVNMAGLMQAPLPPIPELDDGSFSETAPTPLETTPPPDTSDTTNPEDRDDYIPPPPPEPKDYKPVIQLLDAPGVNGLSFNAREWQIVRANSCLQAVSTDEIVMKGTSDGSGYLFSSEEQSRELMQIYQLMPSQLWLVEGNRAHKLAIYEASSELPASVRDYYAQDTMGYHRKFNQTINTCPGKDLGHCVRQESKIAEQDSLLDLLREKK